MICLSNEITDLLGKEMQETGIIWCHDSQGVR